MREIIPAQPHPTPNRIARARYSAAQLAAARTALAWLAFLLLCFLCAIVRAGESSTPNPSYVPGALASPHPRAAL